jgi:nicotinamide phosphoribosyltransferase
VLQGDGIDGLMIKAILDRLVEAGYSSDNVFFGMGGQNLQKVDRDTQKFALKCSAIKINGKWQNVQKDPITDSGKRSKPGRVTLYKTNGVYHSGVED